MTRLQVTLTEVWDTCAAVLILLGLAVAFGVVVGAFGGGVALGYKLIVGLL